jgi:arylsulfatase A-like enzyme
MQFQLNTWVSIMPTRYLLWSLCFICFSIQASPEETTQPNIVLILVDDAGLMDFGGFGGEARTPNIDALAESGVRFGNYHTSPLCAPSRAMLLTGVDNHLTGIGTIPEVVTEAQSRQAGYAMTFTPQIKTVADKLRDSGYRTYMTGKWHLGNEGIRLPVHHGFDRSFALDASGADNWEQKPYMPYYADAPWFEDDHPGKLPDDFYSSKFIVDKMLEYIQDGSSRSSSAPSNSARDEKQAPFFAYLAFQAVHIPVQAPKEFTNHYQGVYQGGWQQLRQQRLDRGKALGLIPEQTKLAEPPAALRDWQSLDRQEQQFFERAMMVNAGMLEAMDHHIGRLVSHLKSIDDFDNTVFIIASDNGPEFNFPTSSNIMKAWMYANDYDADVETLGERGSLAAIGPEWAFAASSPGDLFKFYASEGGQHVPLIISGVGKSQPGFHKALTFVKDITPTILDIANVSAEVQSQGTAMHGRSLSPLLNGTETQVYGATDAIGMEVSGNASLFKGEYKITFNTLPHGTANWGLYHLGTDPGEANDLSTELPELKAEMLADYQRYAEAMNVVAMPVDFNPLKQVGANMLPRMIKRNATSILIGLFLIAALGLMLFRATYRR